nr:glycosyltransferase family 2 protein [uncultured Pseudomonas sp.]
MKIRIGAIFKDEFSYVIEWLAWHQLAGFKDFTIADNGSTDRTLALLEALDSLKLINVMYQPRVQGNAQLTAYRRICERHVGESIGVLFIDADEFLIHDSMVDGAEYKELVRLMSDTDTGMVGINWRCFGSSGLEKKDDRLVLERFTACNTDAMSGKNGHLKSATKPDYAYQVGPHISYLYPPYKRKSVDGKDLTEFVRFESGIAIKETGMPEGIAKNVISGPLRINHYVIKSKEEFVAKKLNRGDAMGGETFKKDLSYFDAHDFADKSFSIPPTKLQKLKSSIAALNGILETSVFASKLIGAVDKSNDRFLSGWVCSQNGEDEPISVVIYVNGVMRGKVKASYFRPDLKDKGLSKSGMCGFYFHHEAYLKNGDEVEVKVFGNHCSLMGLRKAIISGV